MVELLFLAIFIFVLGLVAGVVLLTRAVQRTLGKYEAEAIHELAEHINNQLMFIRVEQSPDLLLAYNALSGDFVCQGLTMEDLVANFSKRYPDKKGILVEPDEGEAHELV